MELAQPQVYSFPAFSLMCSFCFFFGSPPARWRRKNQPQQKKRFDSDLLASALKYYFVLSRYLSTNIPFALFFIIHCLQTCCSLPFCTASKRRLLTPEHMADRAAATLAVLLSKKVPHSSLCSFSNGPRGSGEQVSGPGGSKVSHTDNSFPLRVS